MTEFKYGTFVKITDKKSKEELFEWLESIGYDEYPYGSLKDDYIYAGIYNDGYYDGINWVHTSYTPNYDTITKEDIEAYPLDYGYNCEADIELFKITAQININDIYREEE